MLLSRRQPTVDFSGECAKKAVIGSPDMEATLQAQSQKHIGSKGWVVLKGHLTQLTCSTIPQRMPGEFMQTKMDEWMDGQMDGWLFPNPHPLGIKM